MNTYLAIYRDHQSLAGAWFAGCTVWTQAEFERMTPEIRPHLLIRLQADAEQEQMLVDGKVFYSPNSGRLVSSHSTPPLHWDDKATTEALRLLSSPVESRWKLLRAIVGLTEDAFGRAENRRKMIEAAAPLRLRGIPCGQCDQDPCVCLRPVSRGSRLLEHGYSAPSPHYNLRTQMIAGLEFKETPGEITRVYQISNGMKIIVDKPRWVHVSDSGSHRLITEAGKSVYIPRASGDTVGWVTFDFEVEEGAAPWRW